MQMVNSQETDSVRIPIEKRADLVNLRQTARMLAQDIDGSLRDQARVSWVTNQLGRQMLDMSKGGIIMLDVVSDSDKNGVMVSCTGTWLRLVERTYRFHISPMISRNDEVEYESGRNPRLAITLWMGGD